MKRNIMNFAAKTLSFALFFTVLLFSGRLSAADAGCHNQNGCSTSASATYNSSPFQNPTYSPAWTEVTSSLGRVSSGQFMRFSVVEGNVYSWSTEGKEDVFYGEYAKACTADNQCRTASDVVDKGLRCIGGYCLLPFDTELTLLKGGDCSADEEGKPSKLLAYSNDGGFRNQSQLDWKADFTGTVVLLVTNYEYQDTETGGTFANCQQTQSVINEETGAIEIDMTTTVKWRRTSSEPCTTCGDKNKYYQDYQIPEGSTLKSAPEWTTVQSRAAVQLADFLPPAFTSEYTTGDYPNDLWLKPGSYVVFEVTENQIYRWSTCVADFQDTQLTLFKGDKGHAEGTDDSCGHVLAYGDDSTVSYTRKLKNPGNGGVYEDDENGTISETYCPAGTRQTVLEWQANFSGTVTLLLNEYNCYQCFPQEITVAGGNKYNNWVNCFYEVSHFFRISGYEEGEVEPVTGGKLIEPVFVFDNGWPVEANSCKKSNGEACTGGCKIKDTDGNCLLGAFCYEDGGDGAPCASGTFVYPFPLDWQRYDCTGIDGICSGSAVATVSDTEDSGTAFVSGTAVQIPSGGYVNFILQRGSKYLFKATDPDAIITIKKGLNGCGNTLIDQATGEIAYFADAAYDDGEYGTDKITVYVSGADCRPGENVLTYSYYTTSGNSKDRFKVQTVSGSNAIVTDNSTQLQFVDTGAWAWTWKEAMEKCQSYTVGDSSGSDVLPCPNTVCPDTAAANGTTSGSGAYGGISVNPGLISNLKGYYVDNGNSYFCDYVSIGADSNGNCKLPECGTGYKELQKRVSVSGNTVTILNPEEEDVWGQCYYGGTDCDNSTHEQVDRQLADKTTRPLGGCRNGYTEIAGLCYKCPDGYEMKKEVTKYYCYKYEDVCETNQNCVTINGSCDKDLDEDGELDATKLVCPEGYTEHGDKCVSDTSTSFDMYAEVTLRDLTKPTCTSTSTSGGTVPINCLRDGGEAETCPDGTHDLGDGTCEYDSCGVYAQYSDFVSYSGHFTLKKLLDEDPRGCYAEKNSTAGGYVPCCCSQPINKVKSGNIQATYETLKYATSLNPNGTISTEADWTCENVTSCQSGYTLGDHDNHCYKCLKGVLTWSGGYECYNTCNANETQFGTTCYKCPSGYTLHEFEGGVGLGCVKECPADAYREGSTCYVNTTPKIRVCDIEKGWVEEEGKCRKIQTNSGGDPVYVACKKQVGAMFAGTLKDNTDNVTCDTSKPNSYDCDCFYDHCEEGRRPEDAKKCPKKHQGYIVTPETMPYHLGGGVNAEVVVPGGCHYSDSTGQACGEAMGGWNLPNINQLYSIVDFDLYDPATAYPFNLGGYNRDDIDQGCEPVPNPEPTSCTDNSQCGDTTKYACIGGTCVSIDPFGDLQCDTGGKYLCIDGQCERNNWYWSSTTVVRENAENGLYTWAVNMHDGRSYFAKKGCNDESCATNVDLSARPHHVLCIKGSTIAGIFDADAPTEEQVFSGWACDKDEVKTNLTIYFEIIDSDEKDVVQLLDASDLIETIPGLINKGIKYGTTDDSMITATKSNEIYNNCGFQAGQGEDVHHAFGLKWTDGSVTPGKEDVAEVIMSLKEKECTAAQIAEGATGECALPPYFVTAYAVNENSGSHTGVAITPTKRPFVFTNKCGDGYKTYDGTFKENCESENFGGICVYGNDECQLCAESQMTVSGETVNACTYYDAKPPKCGDDKLQSYYCEEDSEGNYVIKDGYTGEGQECDFYNFAANNIIGSSEECECGGDDYYLFEGDEVNCSPLGAKVCPEYFPIRDANGNKITFNPSADDAACYICSGCKKARVLRARCGDGKIQRENCSGYNNCEVVHGADEECDKNISDSGACTTDCKLGKCGDGHIQSILGEVCDSGIKNGWYATNCSGDSASDSCPGCASVTCGKDDTDALGPRCGDGKVQNQSMCGNESKATAAGYYEDGVFHNYASLQDFYDRNNLVDDETCNERLNGAAEACDLVDAEGQSLNGRPVTFEAFRLTPEGAACAEEIGGIYYPVSAIHPKFLECVYKYKQFLDSHSGCSPDCTAATAPYCGDGKIDDGEICDDGLPSVFYQDGKYTISVTYNDENGLNYNGKKYKSCRLDCRAKYDCDNNIKETESCADVSLEGFCPTVGSSGLLFVKRGPEDCDDGELNGNYGKCAKGCLKKAYCGSGALTSADLDCIKPGSGDSCNEKEECDFGEEGLNPNKPIETAYSTKAYGSCIAEDPDKCTQGVDQWKDADGNDIICCKYGRYCGDGTVDNGWLVGSGVNWKDATLWKKVAGSAGGAKVKYDARNLALRFELTDTTATMELDSEISIDTAMRYLLEFNMMPLTVGIEAPEFKAGANEYDVSGTLLGSAGNQNSSPYLFITDLDETATDWYRGKNAAPISGESIGSTDTWYTGTKKVKLVFRMEGVVGTQFLVRALTFYDINHANYAGSGDSSAEMCDPGSAFFKATSDKYMTDCNDKCEWINYCGDGTVQRSNGCGTDGKYNGYTCVDGIAYAAEVCDNGTNSANIYNGCEPGCLELGPRCGDGFIDRRSCPSGSTNCHTPSGSFTAEEACDNGSLNKNDSISGYVSKLSDYGTCREDCRPSRCGDGILDTVRVDDGTLEGAVVEECDCGAAGAYFEETKNQYTTVNGKKVYLCIDDEGNKLYNTISAQRAALCRPNCKISRCGDGILDQVKDPVTGDIISGEECDDGNFNDHDSCTSECKFNRVGDGIWAHSRSYLCEELKNISTARMQKMKEKGVVDCDDGAITCEQLAAALTSDAAIKTYFESSVLHCCYNQKIGGGNDDHNCELNWDGSLWTPKGLAIKRCETSAENVSGTNNTTISIKTHDQCVELVENTGNNAAYERYDAIEQCERCTDARCGQPSNKPDQQTRNCSTKYSTDTEIKDCIEMNKYCKDTGWNIGGRCGDGKVDASANEICDSNVAEESRYYIDLYDGRWNTPATFNGQSVPDAGSFDSGHRWYNGNYCTGECKGNCSEESPKCVSSTDNNCWLPGCSKKLHRAGTSTERSMCGDGFVDKYAGEECDYGVNLHTEDWYKSYCNYQCKQNRNGGPTGPTAKCGDGEIQERNETCDDGNDADGDYCVSLNGVGCQVYYGSCGDGKITGPGYTFDPLWNDGTLNTNCGDYPCSEGPEDCDTQDARTLSLVNAGIAVANLCNASNNCKRVGYCGDGQKNPRFESCDNGTNNATQNVTANGVTCFAGCKSNPKGGLIKATNSAITGWACDPDHPMTHPATLVRIEIRDSASKLVGKKTIATTIDASGKDYFGKTVTPTSTVKDCGGGSKHGWTYDPSKADTAMDWTNKVQPYTVKAYATSLDGSPETEVFIGEKTFVKAMDCGDNYVSKCSSIEVVMVSETDETWAVGKVCNDADVKDGCVHYGLTNGQACANSDTLTCSDVTVTKIVRTTTTWSNGRTCNDAEVDGECSDYGLTHGQQCKDEQCDDGTNNGDTKDCDSKCQDTKCGDKILQPDSTRAEECEKKDDGTWQTTSCQSVLSKEAGYESIQTISGTASCGTSSCKWVKTSCNIKTNCEALSTVIDSTWTSQGNYKPEKAAQYIKYKNDKYDRTWNGTSWGPRETTVQYGGDGGSPTGQCTFECNDEYFTWDSSKKICVPKTTLTLPCSTCSDPYGVWVTSSGTGSKCKTSSKSVSVTVSIDSSGNVVTSPTSVSTQYNNAYDATTCNWKCGPDADGINTTYIKNDDGGGVCTSNTKTYTCTGKPSGTKWIKVTKGSDGYPVYGDLVDSLQVTQTLNTTSGSATYGQYVPSNAQLAAFDVNDGDYGAKAQRELLDANNPNRCFYSCAGNTVYDPNASGDNKCVAIGCGDGKVYNEDCSKVASGSTCVEYVGADELCDDGGNEGKYWGGGLQTKSHCDKYCGSYKKCVAAEGEANCAYIKATGYNGRIAKGAKYFCGDGKVQVKSSQSDSHLTYDVATVANGYNGASDLSDFTVESCDPNDTKNTTAALCNKALGKSSTPTGGYHAKTGSTVPSCSNSCTISNATKDTGCNYCGDAIIGVSETCETNSSNQIITSSGTYGKSCNSKTYSTSGTTNVTNTWPVPATGRYKIEAYGAAGGTGHDGSGTACNGAYVYGQFDLTVGESLTIVAGGKGAAGSGYNGGQGGTASVVVKNGSPLLIAGGGGGGGWSDQTCSGGQASNSGADAGGNSGGSSGGNGSSSSYANGGVGWNSRSGYIMLGGTGGYDSKSNCNDSTYYSWGGGGGGYSGGAGSGSRDTGGGGGGSYYSGAVSGTTGWSAAVNSGSGYVVITQISYKSCSSCSLSGLTTCN